MTKAKESPRFSSTPAVGQQAHPPIALSCLSTNRTKGSPFIPTTRHLRQRGGSGFRAAGWMATVATRFRTHGNRGISVRDGCPLRTALGRLFDNGTVHMRCSLAVVVLHTLNLETPSGRPAGRAAEGYWVMSAILNVGNRWAEPSNDMEPSDQGLDSPPHPNFPTPPARSRPSPHKQIFLSQRHRRHQIELSSHTTEMA